MTIEEKAKAYDEALKRCKEWASGTWGHSVDDSPKDIAEFIFPQLAESEDESKDERIRKGLIEALKASKTVGELKFVIPEPTREECIAYLEKQKEQKPAEWSEEDEEMLNSCISSIEESKENRYAYKETDGDTSYDREVDWLESLRNRVGKESLQSWNPTEEQMKALLKVVDKARVLHYTSIDGYDGYNALRSLYEQIKKLM